MREGRWTVDGGVHGTQESCQVFTTLAAVLSQLHMHLELVKTWVHLTVQVVIIAGNCTAES